MPEEIDVPEDAFEADGITIGETPGKIVVCFHDEAGVIFAYAMLSKSSANSLFTRARALVDGVWISEQVGHG